MDVIVTHNSFSQVRKSLETLRSKTPADRINKVIFIDQNPEYQQVDDLVDLHLYTGGIGLGFSKAMNFGLRLSDTPYVMCANDDIFYLHPRWIESMEELFALYSTALCCNPNSISNPSAPGAPAVYNPDFPHREEWTDEEYDKLEKEVGRNENGSLFAIDGICTWGPIFKRATLEKVGSTIPFQCYFDEAFPVGGQDYALNYNAYLTKNEDNNFGGYRMLGGGGFVEHLWYQTKRPDGTIGVKWDNTFNKKFGLWEGENMIEAPDIYGKKGIKQIVKNTLKYDW